jgi:hypothetical protein
MLRVLKRHPDSVCDAVVRIDASLARQGALLVLRVIVHGSTPALMIPPMATTSRADELWQRTCCEAFVRTDNEYYEFNLSPSTQWAAYRFSGYRQGMSNAQITAPTIVVASDATQFELNATIDCEQLSLPRSQKWRAGISMVIEEVTGRKSYWALAHAPGKPDFHHADGFVIDLESSVEF